MNQGPTAGDDLPPDVRRHLEAGTRHHAARNLPAALQEYQAAARLAPDHEAVQAALGALAMDAGDWAAAERIHRALDARFPGRHRPRLALALFNLARYDEALPLLAALVERGNTDIACILAYAAALERTGHEDQALAVLESLYRAAPTPAFAVHLASALSRLGRHAQLGERLPALLAQHPGNAQLLATLSEHALNSGDYARGFDLLHHRWAVSLEPPKSARLACPAWDGQPFAGELLVTAEQGLGDEILASSMFGELVRIGQRCRIDCAPRLLPVFRRAFPSLVFCDRHGPALEEAARSGTCRRIEALELGRLYRRDSGQFPARAAWLAADPARRDALRARLQAQFPGRRLVGLSWRSARLFLGDAKSIPLGELAPLLGMTDCAFIDLQYGDTTAERAAVAAGTGAVLHHLPDLDLTGDIDGLFALVDALDAVVSSSNTTVHVAGALGKPVHAMIPGSRYSLWYWGYDGDRTPWYPSVRLHRGPARTPWRVLAAEVADTLRREVPLP